MQMLHLDSFKYFHWVGAFSPSMRCSRSRGVCEPIGPPKLRCHAAVPGALCQSEPKRLHRGRRWGKTAAYPILSLDVEKSMREPPISGGLK